MRAGTRRETREIVREMYKYSTCDECDRYVKCLATFQTKMNEY